MRSTCATKELRQRATSNATARRIVVGIGRFMRLTSEYTGLRMTIVKFHKTMGFSSLFNALSSFSENDSFLHTQVCEILIYPTRTGDDCQSVERTLNSPPSTVQDMRRDNHFPHGHFCQT